MFKQLLLKKYPRCRYCNYLDMVEAIARNNSAQREELFDRWSRIVEQVKANAGEGRYYPTEEVNVHIPADARKHQLYVHLDERDVVDAFVIVGVNRQKGNIYWSAFNPKTEERNKAFTELFDCMEDSLFKYQGLNELQANIISPEYEWIDESNGDAIRGKDRLPFYKWLMARNYLYHSQTVGSSYRNVSFHILVKPREDFLKGYDELPPIIFQQPVKRSILPEEDKKALEKFAKGMKIWIADSQKELKGIIMPSQRETALYSENASAPKGGDPSGNTFRGCLGAGYIDPSLNHAVLCQIDADDKVCTIAEQADQSALTKIFCHVNSTNKTMGFIRYKSEWDEYSKIKVSPVGEIEEKSYTLCYWIYRSDLFNSQVDKSEEIGTFDKIKKMDTADNSNAVCACKSKSIFVLYFICDFQREVHAVAYRWMDCCRNRKILESLWFYQQKCKKDKELDNNNTIQSFAKATSLFPHSANYLLWQAIRLSEQIWDIYSNVKIMENYRNLCILYKSHEEFLQLLQKFDNNLQNEENNEEDKFDKEKARILKRLPVIAFYSNLPLPPINMDAKGQKQFRKWIIYLLVARKYFQILQNQDQQNLYISEDDFAELLFPIPPSTFPSPLITEAKTGWKKSTFRIYLSRKAGLRLSDLLYAPNGRSSKKRLRLKISDQERDTLQSILFQDKLMKMDDNQKTREYWSSCEDAELFLFGSKSQ